MRQNNDLLSPDSSPQKLATTGVKRVNNRPLFIAVGVLTVFIMLIALVALKRANAQNQVTTPVQLHAPKKNTMSLAYEIVDRQKPGMMAFDETKESAQEPALVQQNLSSEQATGNQNHLSDSERERIRQEKVQDFEEAVKAKTSVMIEDTRFSSRDDAKDMDAKRYGAVDSDAANTFKAQLQLLQGEKTSKPMPHTLGGDENSMRWHLNAQLENPNSRFELRAGSVIPGVMVSGISSELPGQIIGQVSQNVYDTASGQYLLIPQGTKLVGIYSSDVSFGQDSVLVAWQRLVFPDGKALDIGSMPGADSAGYGGFRDKVNHHYASIYGSALLMSGIVAGISYSQNINQPNQIGYGFPTAGNVLSQALGQQLGETTSQMVSKNLNVSPTIHVRPGYRFNIIVIKDLTFKQPYRASA